MQQCATNVVRGFMKCCNRLAGALSKSFSSIFDQALDLSVINRHHKSERYKKNVFELFFQVYDAI